jgi:NAD(P)H-hydrate epimerase
MINAHQFKDAAKKFRAGRISLSEFTDLVIESKPLRKPNEALKKDPKKVKTPSGLIEPLLRQLRDRAVDSHKGDFGRIIAIGGSEGMAGAITLTGMAALRSGSGMVKVAVPEMIQGLVASNNPCLMTIGCTADGDCFHGANESSLSHHCEWADVVAIGPGMGRGEAQQWIVKNLYAKIPQPMIVDADGLNALADCESVDLSVHEGQRILTPHPGEFCRLVAQQITSRDSLEKRATELAHETRAVVVLKGNRTFVTDGQQSFRNSTGNPGMATAGSGDVLTGVISSFVGQGFSPFEAAALGVHLHGKAGDEAAQLVGATSLIATDIVENLAAAMRV